MEKQKYNLGLVSVSFRKNTPEEILQAMSSAGLTHIEWGSDVHAPCKDITRLEEIVKLQKEYGITCSSYGTYFRLGTTPLDELEDYITAAKILGTNVIRLWCGTKSGAQMTEEERAHFIEECRSAAKIAEKHGVTFCMECHHQTFTENSDDAVYLMEQVASDSFKMYWQPFQWQTPQQNVLNAEKVAPYAVNIHVFNWQNKDKFPLADAVNEWREYLSRFSQIGALLLEFMPNGTIEELETEASALRQIVGGED